MNSEGEPRENENEDKNHVVGDVIGDTAYSERFVLKTLLKLSDVNLIKDGINEQSLLNDLRTLWNMTAEKDVVLYLLKHDAFELFNFVLERCRFAEVIIGIIGNMCCLTEGVRVLMGKRIFLKLLICYINHQNSLILIQLLRLINSCLYRANEEDIIIWMELFEHINYSKSLYFILNNSCVVDLLMNALENISFLGKYCNIEKTKESFFKQFVGLETIKSVMVAFTEVVVNNKDRCSRDEIEKVYGYSLVTIQSLFDLDKTPETHKIAKKNALSIIKIILHHFEHKLIKLKDIDTDLVDIIDLINTIVREMHINEVCSIHYYFKPVYRMWKALHLATSSHQNGNSDFEDSSEDLAILSNQIKLSMCNLLCHYMLKCSKSNLLQALDVMHTDYNIIINDVSRQELRDNVLKRTLLFKARLDAKLK